MIALTLPATHRLLTEDSHPIKDIDRQIAQACISPDQAEATSPADFMAQWADRHC